MPEFAKKNDKVSEKCKCTNGYWIKYARFFTYLPWRDGKLYFSKECEIVCFEGTVNCIYELGSNRWYQYKSIYSYFVANLSTLFNCHCPQWDTQAGAEATVNYAGVFIFCWWKKKSSAQLIQQIGVLHILRSIWANLKQLIQLNSSSP